jgi:putative restriction endonuclease
VIEQGTYLDFPNSVPFNDATGPIERGVLNEEGRISGRAQPAVRPLSPDDFKRIVKLGLEETRHYCPVWVNLPRPLDSKKTRRLSDSMSSASA